MKNTRGALKRFLLIILVIFLLPINMVNAKNKVERPEVKTDSTIVGTGTGLLGRYYNDSRFTDLDRIRVDSHINLDWRELMASSHPTKRYQSVLWTGKVEPLYSGEYRFDAIAKDGAKIWVNGQLIIDSYQKMVQKEAEALVSEEEELDAIYDEDSVDVMIYDQRKGQQEQSVFLNQDEAVDVNDSLTTDLDESLKTENKRFKNNWPFGDEEISGFINLEQGVKYDIRIEYNCSSLSSKIKLYWSSEEQEKEIIPSSQLYPEELPQLGVGDGTGLMGRYFEDNDFGSLSFIKTDRVINFDFKDFMDKFYLMNKYSIRWTGFIQPQVSGEHVFYANSGGDIKVWIDDMLVIDGSNKVFSDEYIGKIVLSEGEKYRIKIEYKKTYGINKINLMWSCGEMLKTLVPTSQLYEDALPQDDSSGGGTGLKGEYYADSNFSSLSSEKIDSVINLDNGEGFSNKKNDRIRSIRWTGKIEPRYTGKYFLYLESFGAAKLWVDGQLIIDRKKNNINKVDQAQISLVAGNLYDIKIEYTNTMWKPIINLSWSSYDQAKEIIPASQLFPVGVAKFITANATETSVSLQWEKCSQATGYDIEADGVLLENVENSFITIENLIPGSEYFFRVRARNGSIYDNWSDPFKVWTLPDKVQGVELSATETSINMEWESVTGADAYDLELNGQLVEDITSPYTSNNLIPGNKYVCKLRAKNDSGVGQWNSEAIIWTVPDKIDILSHIATENTIELLWEIQAGAIGYDLDIDGVIFEDVSSPYLHSDLEAGKNYIYRIRAKNESGTGQWSSPFIKWTLPSIVENIESFSTQNQIAISWENVQGATAYDVEFDGVLIEDIVFSYTQEALKSGTEHSFKVRAKNESGTGAWSEMYYKWTIPDIVSVLDFTATETKIELDWNDVIGANSYEIEVDGEIFEVTESSYEHLTLSPGVRHSYRIRAINSGGYGLWTENKVIWTLPDIVKPLEASAKQTEVIINWDPVVGAEGYDIEIDGVLISDVTCPYIHTELNPGTAYNYRIRATNTSGYGKWSNALNVVTIPDSIKNISSIGLEKSIELDWEEVQGAEGYDILFGDEIFKDVERPFVSEGLVAGYLYEYKIRAKNISGEGIWSEGFIIWTLPEIPEVIHNTLEERTIIVEWNNVVGAVGYEIEVDGNIFESQSNRFEISNLLPGSEHIIKIRAFNSSGNGKWSEYYTLYTLPEAVKAIESESTQTYANIMWNDVIGATAYDIEIDGVEAYNVESPYMVNDLMSGTKHLVRIRSKNISGKGQWSEYFTIWTIPDIVKNIQGESGIESNGITWDVVEGATSYEIEILGSPVDTLGHNNYTHFGLNPNTQYTYRVRAKNSAGIGEWSSIIAKTTLPQRPDIIDAFSTDTFIEINWESVAGAREYEIEANDIIVDHIDSTQYIIEQLQSNEGYKIRVRATNEDGKGEWSKVLLIKTLLASPQNVDYEVDSNGVSISWDTVQYAERYMLVIDGKEYFTESNTYIHIGLEPNTSYRFKIKGISEDNDGKWSMEQSVTTLLNPPEEIKHSVSSTDIKLEWNMLPDAIKYEIEVNGEIIDNALSTVYKHDGLMPFTEYKYRIRVKNSAGYSEWSPYIDIVTLIGTPEGVDYTPQTSSIEILWQKVEGAQGYEIMVDGEVLALGDKQTYLHSNLIANSVHIYKVRAIRNDYVGEWTEPITGRTLVAIPNNIEIKEDSRRIQIAWDAVEGALSYDIEINSGQIENSLTQYYEHKELQPNTEYSYRIRAKNDIGTSGWSKLMTVYTAPEIPSGIYTEANTNEVFIQWEQAEGALTFDIEVDGSVIEGIEQTQYIHQGLKTNSRHTYRIRSRSNEAVSGWSSIIIQNTVPEILIPVEKDNIFNFVIVVPAKNSEEDRIIIVTYNPEELEVFDLYAATPEPETEAGIISNTNIEVTEFEAGKITYRIKGNDKTIVNIIKFLSKTSGHSNVTYTIKSGGKG